MKKITLYYIYDPMCSWCWAFTPALNELKSRLTEKTDVYLLMGGLAADSDVPMPMAMRQQIEQVWKQIEQRTGAEFNYRFWTDNTPRRSTYPACRAVIAAGLMPEQQDEAMIEAIQHGYYLDAKNPSDDDTLIALADSLGLNATEFTQALGDTATAQLFSDQLAFVQQLGIQGFPSLVLYREGHYHSVSHGYCDAAVLEQRLKRLGVI